MMELISKEVVKRIIDSERTREQMLGMVESAVTFESSTESTDSSNESSTDCISREAAIRACCGMSRFTGIDEAPYEYVEDVLRELPSVKPKKRTGHWIAVYQGD